MTRFKIWGIRRLLTILPVLFLSQLETVLTKATATQNATDTTVLKCLLRRVPPQPCVKLTGYMLPGRFREMYANMNREMKEGIRNGILEMIAPEDFARLPVPLFLLLSSQRLRKVSGTALAAMLGHHHEDSAVTVKIMGILNPPLFEEFFKKLEGVHLSSDAQDKIADTLVRWLPDAMNDWSFKKFRMIQNVGNPLLAHLPPYFLANLSTPESTKFLFHLRNWLWSTLPTDMWGEKTEATKRAWADMMFRSSYPFNLSEWKESEGRRFRYLLEGATPDELKYLNAEQLQSSKLFKTKLSRLQVRTLFDILYSSGGLITANLTEEQLLPVALLLSPTNLLRFNVSLTDFRVLKYVFETGENFCSFSTAKQILESLITQSVLSGRLESVNPETWSNGIEHLGKFIYVLPTRAFESYISSPLSALVQSKIDSEKLSARQAHLLTGENVLNMEKPDLMLGLKGLLKALSTSQLVAAGTLPQNVLFHLLQHLPSGMHMQAVALLQKVEKLNGHTTILEKILSNNDPNQFFQNLPSRTVLGIKSDLEKLKEFNTAIERLPQNTLSVLLTSTRSKLTNKDHLWSSDTLLSEGSKTALLGLSCNDIYAMETVDFIYIMEQYNDARKSLKRPFPKDLQYCSQMALMNYLEMKASLQDITYSQELLDYLEPAEIEAVGGYILANLPPQDIEKSMHSKNILESIGQLPLQELLLATKETTPHIYAQLLLQKLKNTSLGAQELFSLGNLAYFLPATDIQKIDPGIFKLFIESSNESKTLCVDSTSRRAWYQVIQTAFGEPFNWTAGTLAILGDLLMVVPRDDLNSVPEGSWKDAADTLTEKTSYHKRIEWPGKVYSIPFYQACAEILEASEVSSFVAAVKGLTRWYLAAVQMQLSTVVDATKLLAMVHHLKKGKAERKMVMPKYPVEIEFPQTVVKVLEPDEVEKAVGAQRPGAEVELTTVSPQDKDFDTSIIKQQDEESYGSKSKNKKFRRHVPEEDFDVQDDENSKAQHSGEVLREILRTNNLATKIETTTETTTSQETGITIEPTEEIETTKLWEKVTCDAIKAAGMMAELALNVNDIEEMDVEELNVCVDALGMLKLDDDVQKKIWSLVNKDKLFENLSDLGHLVKNIDVEDISRVDMNLSSPYALDNIAILNEMVDDNHVLNEVGSHFVKSNPDIKTISTETTVALGRVLCEVILVSSHKLHFMLTPSVFLKASPALGRIRDCPTHCLHKLVNLAIKPSEYGPLGTWTAEDVASLGVILAGLKPEQWRLLSATGYGNNPLVGLSPSAVKCIPPQIFKVLDDDQLKSLPSLSAAVVSNEQLSHLSESQQIALLRVQTEVPAWKPSPNIVQSTEVIIDIEDTGTASVTKSSLLVVVVLAVISRFSS